MLLLKGDGGVFISYLKNIFLASEIHSYCEPLAVCTLRGCPHLPRTNRVCVWLITQVLVYDFRSRVADVLLNLMSMYVNMAAL